MSDYIPLDNQAYDDGFIFDVMSEKRLNPLLETDSNFTYKIVVPTPPKGLEFNTVAITDIGIPKSWWLVTEPYNTMEVIELGVTYTITVLPGNYTAKQWVIEFPRLLTANSAAVGNNWVYTASRHTAPDTGLIDYAVSGNGGNQPSFVINSRGYLSEQVGFESGTTTPFVNDTLTTTTVYNANQEYAVRLRSNICEAEGNDTLVDCYASSSTPYDGIVVWQAQDNILQSRRFVRSGSSVYYFQLVGGNTGLPLDLHGRACTFRGKIFRREKAEINYIREMLRVQTKILDNLVIMNKFFEKFSLSIAQENEDQDNQDDSNNEQKQQPQPQPQPQPQISRPTLAPVLSASTSIPEIELDSTPIRPTAPIVGPSIPGVPGPVGTDTGIGSIAQPVPWTHPALNPVNTDPYPRNDEYIDQNHDSPEKNNVGLSPPSLNTT